VFTLEIVPNRYRTEYDAHNQPAERRHKMRRRMLSLCSIKAILLAVVPAIILLAGIEQAMADLTIGGAVYTDLANPLTTGLPDVTVTVTGDQGTFDANTAGAQGIWQMDVPEGTYTVTPRRPGYGFEHIVAGVSDGLGSTTIVVNTDNLGPNQSIQFLATEGGASQYSLTASVAGANGSVSPASGTFAAGTVVPLTATPDAGYRVKAWTGTDNDSATTNTNNVTMDSNKTVTVEFEAIPVVAFVSADSSGSETVVAVNLTVSLSVTSSETVMVNYSTGGTATSGVDYTLVSGPLTFSPGETEKHIPLTVVDDVLDEPDETVVVTLSSPTNAVLGSPVSHTYTIIDNDPEPTVEFAAKGSSGEEGAEGTSSQVLVTVSLSAASGKTVTVDYATNGTATGEDYTIEAGPLTFSPSETTMNIPMTILGDSSGEADETIVVTLTGATNATIGAIGTYTHTIINDDPSSVQFAAISSSGPETDSPAILDVQLLPAIDKTVTVDYSVSPESSATGGGADYTLADGTLTFQANQTDANIPIPIVDDSVQEPDETIVVILSNPSVDATIGTNATHTYTILNDDDETDPNTYGHIPEPNSIQVPMDTIIQIHVRDMMIASTSGVDANTVQIRVEGEVVYDGAAAEPNGTYSSDMGICTRTGAPADYTFTYALKTPLRFGYEQKVDVTVNAADEGGNVMPEEAYHFYTVMRSFGRNIKVNSDTGFPVQSRPATARDSVGNTWAVWGQRTADGDTDICIGKLEAGGDAFGASVRITNDANDQSNPDIAIDDSDNICVAWQGDDPNGNWDVFVSTSSDGYDWSVPVVVNVGDPNNTSDQTRPSIGIDMPRLICVAYQDNRADNNDIWIATSTDGSTWAETQITTDTNEQTEPSVAIDPDNTACIAWTDARNLATTGTDIYGATSDDGPWKNLALVNTASNQSSPVCALSGGLIHLLWVDDASGAYDVFYGNDASGLPLIGSNIMDVNDSIDANQVEPAIAVRSTGASPKIFACWRDDRTSGDIGDIYFTESGSSFVNRTSVLVNDDVGINTQTDPAIGTDRNGSPYAVWVDDRNDNNDIYYAGATFVGEPLQATMVTASDPNTQLVQINETSDGVDDVNDVIVEIPAGALVADITITIAELLNPPEPPPGGFGAYYDFGPSGLQFNVPVTITIPHNASDCPGLPIYKVYWYNHQTGTWSQEGISDIEHLTDSHDPSLPFGVHIVRFKTTHFTPFGVGASEPDGDGRLRDQPDWPSGGGGDGGCAMSPYGQGRVTEFLLPYIGFFIVLLAVSLVDARRRKARCNRQQTE